METKNYVCYEDFGAVGDGVTDDMPAIVRAHEYANEKGLPVITKPDATYYIGGKNITAVIKTNVNFGTSKFIIDDRQLENVKNVVFSVQSDNQIYTTEITSLKAGQKKIDFPHEGLTFLRVFNDNHKIFIRKGLNQNAGTPITDCILVDGEGNVLTSIDWDYEGITKQYARKVDENELVIEGGIFTTIANQWERVYNYHNRNIDIKRSKVTIKGLTHYIEGEGDTGAPYSGFLNSSETVDLTIIDCLLTPHKTYQTKDSVPGRVNCMGTYDLGFGATINTRLINVKQTRDIMDSAYWGLMGSNFCKQMLLERCDMSRFDAHCGVSDATIRGCRLGHQCLNLIGFGNFLIEDSFALGNAFINLRGDYGSIWRGNVTIRNCTWKPRSNTSTSVFHANNTQDHDFGYTCYMPINIVIDGLTVQDSEVNDGVPLYILPDFDPEHEKGKPYPYVTTKTLTYSGIVSEKGREPVVCKNEAQYEGIEVSTK